MRKLIAVAKEKGMRQIRLRTANETVAAWYQQKGLGFTYAHADRTLATDKWGIRYNMKLDL
jgi:hypothetical protein